MALDIKDKMKAIVVHEQGDPSKLVVEDVPVPKPGANQVLVEVKAAGVNPVETYMREGKNKYSITLPWTPGNDGAGVVAAVGEGVTSLSIGKRVWISGSLSGTYAQYSLCDASSVHPLPFNVSYEQGAALGIPYRTAYRALFQKCHAKPGSTLLVHGGTGGVGLAAIQFAVAAGIKVYATAGTSEGEELLKQEGAVAFNHTAGDYTKNLLAANGGQGVDSIIEMLANVNLATDLTLLAPSGVVAIVGTRGKIEIDPREILAREAVVVGVRGIASGADGVEACAAINAGLATRALRPLVGRTFPLSKAPDAHVEVIAHSGGTKGKIVLQPWV